MIMTLRPKTWVLLYRDDASIVGTYETFNDARHSLLQHTQHTQHTDSDDALVIRAYRAGRPVGNPLSPDEV